MKKELLYKVLNVLYNICDKATLILAILFIGYFMIYRIISEVLFDWTLLYFMLSILFNPKRWKTFWD